MILLASIALADGIHAGIRPGGHGILGDPVHSWPESGWSASILDDEPGVVRVLVARTEDEATQWFEREASNAGVHRVAPSGADTARGDMHTNMVWRDGNVVAVIHRPAGAAADLAERLHASLQASGPWPEAPTLTFDGTRASVDGEWAAVRFRVPLQVDRKTMLPVPTPVVPTGPNSAALSVPSAQITAIVWDRFGRGAAVTQTVSR